MSDGWARAAVRFRGARRITEEDARRLAPAFDQVSMFHAPGADGQVRERDYPRPPVVAEWLDVWDEARTAARDFWSRVGDDVRVAEALRRAAASHLRQLTPAGSTLRDRS